MFITTIQLALIASGCILVGGILFACVAWALGRLEKVAFTKLIVGLLLIHGIIWIDLSYALAWRGANDIAESLSKIVLVEIIAVIFIYCVKSLFENISKHNNWPDKKPTNGIGFKKEEGGEENGDC